MSSVVTGLNKILANSYSIYLKTHNYHWNVKGPNFYQLHIFFEKQYEELAEAVDTIAERIRALGALSAGSFEEFIKLRTLNDGKSSNNWEQMLKDLSSDHQALVDMLKNFSKVCDDAGDEATQDLIIERLREHEKTIWMLNAHLNKN